MSAKITEIAVTYSVTIRSNIGDFESSDAHISKSEKWDVQGLTPEESAILWTKRYELLKFELDALIKAEYDQTSRYGRDNEVE